MGCYNFCTVVVFTAASDFFFESRPGYFVTTYDVTVKSYWVYIVIEIWVCYVNVAAAGEQTTQHWIVSNFKLSPLHDALIFADFGIYNFDEDCICMKESVLRLWHTYTPVSDMRNQYQSTGTRNRSVCHRFLVPIYTGTCCRYGVEHVLFCYRMPVRNMSIFGLSLHLAPDR